MELHKISRRSFLEATALSGAAAVFSHPLSGGLVSTASAAEAPIAAAAEEETKIVKTCCRACIHNCGVLAHVRNGRVVKLEGNPEYPMSKGALCAKALSGVSALYHPTAINIRFFESASAARTNGDAFRGMRPLTSLPRRWKPYGMSMVQKPCSSPLAAAAILHSAAFHAFATPLEHQTGTNQGARSVISRERSPTT